MTVLTRVRLFVAFLALVRRLFAFGMFLSHVVVRLFGCRSRHRVVQWSGRWWWRRRRCLLRNFDRAGGHRSFVLFLNNFGACLRIVSNFLQLANDRLLLALLLLRLFVAPFGRSFFSSLSSFSTKEFYLFLLLNDPFIEEELWIRVLFQNRCPVGRKLVQ